MEFPFPQSQAPTPPYSAVIFSSIRQETPEDGYEDQLGKLLELLPKQDGFLGVESIYRATGKSSHTHRPEGEIEEFEELTVSYWRDEAAVKGWKRDLQHLMAQKMGKKKWYRRFEIRVCTVERAYGFDAFAGVEGEADANGGSAEAENAAASL